MLPSIVSMQARNSRKTQIAYFPLSSSSRTLPTSFYVPCSIVFYDTDALEVTNVINRMKKSGGSKDIPLKFLKLCFNFESEWSGRIFSLSIRTANFPSLLKKAKVIPVYQKGSRTEIFNHRRIAV